MNHCFVLQRQLYATYWLPVLTCAIADKHNGSQLYSGELSDASPNHYLYPLDVQLSSVESGNQVLKPGSYRLEVEQHDT